ncbi:MAG: extracellular solute-binding protein [Treponema sp.]|jgi:ABC-type glycerol-3-phosphate transport system substrate-binding protein|nr:extracellular solute-binding protein [Treponema sp.]
MAVKPADRLLFVIALTAFGITLAVKLAVPGEKETPAGPESLSLTIHLAEGSGLEAEDLEILITGYPRESQNSAQPDYVLGQGAAIPPASGSADNDNNNSVIQIDITINAEDRIPDILIAGGQSLAGGIGAGLYLPLDRYYHAESQPFSTAGNWALPLVSAIDVLVYNIPLLQEAGFDRPPRTREDFLLYARTIRALDEENRTPGRRYALALGLSPLDPRGLGRDIYSWFYASALLLPKEGKPEFGGQDYTATLDFFSTLNHEELIAPGSFSATGADRIEEFIRGTAAMMVVSTRDLRYIREKMGNEAIGITLIPHAAAYAGRPVFGLSTWYAGISAESPHPDESWALLQHLREQSAFLAESLALVPGTGNYGPYISVDPLLDKAWSLYEAAETVPDFLSPGAVEDPDGAFRRELILMFQSSTSAQEAARAIRQSWEER